MQKIMVFDVPAEKGGALSILNDFYKEAVTFQDKSIKWIFVISTPKLIETENVKVLRFPWIKKSWGHRLFFDNIIAPYIIKKYKIDKVLSLQNVIIPRTKVPQILYVHQALPFSQYIFSFKKDKLFWIYQNIIGRKIFNSIKKADKVIVQTKWMKEAIIEKVGINEEKINVIPPKININIKGYYEDCEIYRSTFFYPAGPQRYKNHKVIIDACKKLVDMGNKDFKVIFTLKGNENSEIINLYNETLKEKLPIEFIGGLSREQVFNMYTRSVLLFPSYLETFGLPLLEARLHKGIILASDTPFSHEILNGYANAYFFHPFNAKHLAELMNKVYKKRIKYSQSNNYENINSNKYSLIKLIKG